MTITIERVAYAPWHLMSNREKNICVAETVLGWKRYYDLDHNRIRWIMVYQYGERYAPEDFPPNYVDDPKALDEIKRKLDSWTVTKVSTRHFNAVAMDESGRAAYASGTNEADALLQAAVRLFGACV